MNERTNERIRACFAIHDICSALALLVGSGNGSANIIISRRCVKENLKNPSMLSVCTIQTERKSDKKNDQFFPS